MEIIDLSQCDRWDEIVKSFPNHDVYYLSGYVKAFKVHGDGEPVLLHYTGKGGARAICVLMIRDVAQDSRFKDFIPESRYFDAVTPYGYGGFLFDGTVDIDDLKKEFNEALRSQKVNCAFFRFHPILETANTNAGIVDIIPLGKTIAMDLGSPEIIWENIISKNRNMIRKAEKSHVEIHHSADPRLFATFKEIYDDTMRRDHAEEGYFFEEAFYESIANDLNGNYELFYATCDDKIISISIMIFANDQMHYHLSGSLKEYRSLAPSNLLLYKAALWGQENGYSTFHLGGGVGSDEDPLYKFKAAFNRRSDFRFAIGKTIIIPEDYDYLLNLRDFTEEEKESICYFPQYRANHSSNN